MTLDKDTLINLLKEPWQTIVVQGGKITKFPFDSSYSLSGIWVYVSMHWIEIGTTEIEDEEFILSICTLDEPPIPEKLRNKPPRKILEYCPPDCDFKKLLVYGVEDIKADDLEQKDGELLSVSPLFIKCKDGTVFKISSNERVLGDIILEEV